MNITITLGAATYCRLPEDTFVLLPEDEVKISFLSPIYPLVTLVVTAQNGSMEKSYKTSGKAIDITELCKTAGEVKITVALTYQGEVTKTWQVEALKIKEIKNIYEAIPEVEDMKARLGVMEQAFSELRATIENEEM